MLLTLSLLIVQERALEYLTGCIDQVAEFNDILQLVIVELVYKVHLCVCVCVCVCVQVCSSVFVCVCI